MRRRISTAGGAAALVLLALAGPALGWTKPAKIAPGAQAPIYAADGQGGFHSLFARPTSGGGFHLLYAKPGGSAVRVDTDAAPAGGDYSLAVAANGSVSAVWCTAARSDRSPGVYASTKVGSRPFSPPVELSAPVPGSGIGDSCAADAVSVPLRPGLAVVVWHLTGSGGDALKESAVSAGGFAPPKTLDTPPERALPMDLAVDTEGRATVAWLTGGVLRAARQADAGGDFSVARVSAACNFGASSVRVAADTAGNAVVLFARCASRGRHVVELAHAAAERPFGAIQRVVKTRFADIGLALSLTGRLAVTWRSVYGNLYASTGTAAAGIQRRQRLNVAPAHFRRGVDTHATAIDTRGRIVVAWIQRSLERNAVALIRTSNAAGRFGPSRKRIRAPRGTSARVAVNARGDTAVAWRVGNDRIVATTRKRGRAFRRPRTVARGGIQAEAIVASGRNVLLTWLTRSLEPRFSRQGF